MKPKSKLIWGIVLVSFGIILLGETTGAFDIEDLVSTLLPVGMIVFGIFLIVRRKKTVERATLTPYDIPPPPPPPQYSSKLDQSPTSGQDSDSETASEQQPSSYDSSNYEPGRDWERPESDSAGKLKYSKTFGDMSIDFSGVILQSAEVSAGIGDLEIRLQGCMMADGLNRLIISSFVGDIRIYASHEMPVFAHCSNFVGDIEVMGKRASGFGNSIDSQTTNYEASTTKLYVACNSFIGDIKILGL